MNFFINKFNQNKLIVVLLIFISLGVILAFSASACQNTCLNSGDKQCATITINNTTYSGYKICGDYNNDGCREWSGIYACPSGKVCNPVDYSCCTPATCSGLGHNCGAWADNCGGTINCGTCSANQICSAGLCTSNCTSHATKKCSNGNLYWYNSCNVIEDLAQNCGINQTTSNYRCSGNWVQQEIIQKGCSNNACFSNSSWNNVRDCSAANQICSAGTCISNNSPCTPKTCSQIGAVCGAVSDGCGGTINCSCSAGYNCINNICVAPAAPAIDIRVNGVSNSLEVDVGSSIVISWTATNASSCTAYGAWSGSQNTSGLYTATALQGSNSYSLICSGAGGTATASITVKGVDKTPVIALPSSLQLTDGSSAILNAVVSETRENNLIYNWSCSLGRLSSPSVLTPTYYAPSNISIPMTAICTLTVQDSRGRTTSKSTTITIQPRGTNVNSTLKPSTPVSGAPVSAAPSTTAALNRSQLLAAIAQIQTKIAQLQAQLAILNAQPVATTGRGNLSVNTMVGNVTQALPFATSINAHRGDMVTFKITVANDANGTFAKVKLYINLPYVLTSPQNIKINGAAASESFSQGLDLGGFWSNQIKTVTFASQVSDSSPAGVFTLSATASAEAISANSSTTITIN